MKYYACARKNLPISSKGLKHGWGPLAASIRIVGNSVLCNFKWTEWNPGVQATMEVYLRGLTTQLRVANSSQLHQLAQNGCPRCGNYRNVKYKITQDSERMKTSKQGNRYYACAMKTRSETWNRFIQCCGKWRRTMKITVPLCACNFKSLQWNRPAQTRI